MLRYEPPTGAMDARYLAGLECYDGTDTSAAVVPIQAL